LQTSDLAEKVRLFYDGTEYNGLVKWPGITLEQGTIEVPENGAIRNITNGQVKYPILELTYKVDQSAATMKFFKSWFDNKESHDVTIIRTDASGAEFDRSIMNSVECSKYQTNAVDMGGITYAQIMVTLVPFDHFDVAVES
jgi:hypothetical protein